MAFLLNRVVMIWQLNKRRSCAARNFDEGNSACLCTGGLIPVRQKAAAYGIEGKIISISPAGFTLTALGPLPSGTGPGAEIETLWRRGNVFTQ